MKQLLIIKHKQLINKIKISDSLGNNIPKLKQNKIQN